MVTEAYRQGDVIIIPDRKKPKDAEKLDHLILALGEQTGHSHQIEKGNALLYAVAGMPGFLDVKDETVDLVHEEHGKIALPKGTYEVRIQREYEPDGWRSVAD